MTTETTSLESVIAKARAKLAAEDSALALKSDWSKAFGAVQDDPLFREAALLGEEWRKMENQRH